MADTPQIPKLLADNPAAAQRYLRMVAAVGGVPDVGDVVDDLVLEALYGAFGEDGAGVPVVGRGRPWSGSFVARGEPCGRAARRWRLSRNKKVEILYPTLNPAARAPRCHCRAGSGRVRLRRRG